MAALRRATSEPALSQYYAERLDAPRTWPSFTVRHPVRTLVAALAVLRLPVEVAALSGSSDGRAVRRALTVPEALRLPMAWTGLSHLSIPADPAQFDQGSSMQTLRRKARASAKRGVTTAVVERHAEKVDLMRRSEKMESSHPDPQYRRTEVDDSYLLEHDFWMTALAADGEPLLLAVFAIDGEWALMVHFRTLGTGPVYSDSRYLMTGAAAQELSRRGVRHIVDTWHPVSLPNGLRHFQRMVGFRTVRVRLTRAANGHQLEPATSRPAATGEVAAGPAVG